MMKNRYTLLAVLCMALVCDIAAQSKQQLPKLTVTDEEVRFANTESFLRGDSLYVRFDFVMSGDVLSSGEALHVVPVYRANGKELRFPEVLINGKKRAKFYHREQTLASHDAYWANRPYALFTYHPRRFQTISYSFAYPLPVDMRDGGRLAVEQLLEDCCDLRLIAAKPFSIKMAGRETPLVSHTPIEPAASRLVSESSVTFIRPEVEQVKERNERLTLRINYIVDRYDVLPHYANNASELQKVDDVLRPLSSRREIYQIGSASIKGYASPEATYAYNLKLSKHRANGFKQYLINRYGLYSLARFSAVGMGEDWDGLRAAVDQSQMMYRDEVLSIIDGVGIFNGREKQLMDLAGGEPYRYMLRTFCPALRRMEMEITYTVRSFKLAQAEEMIKERPQDLSQQEMFDVARTHKDNEQLRVAATFFPNDATANINAASAALVVGELEAAYAYLRKVWSNPQAFNNIGVYYLIKGDYPQAEQYFRRALTGADRHKAAYNLKLINQLQHSQR